MPCSARPAPDQAAPFPTNSSSSQHLREALDCVGVGVGCGDRPGHFAQANLLLADTAAYHLARIVEVDGTGTPAHRLPQCQVHVLGDPRHAVDATRPLAARLCERHLVGFLEPAHAARGAVRGAAQHDERHGTLGRDVHGGDGVGHPGARAHHQYPGFLLRPAPGRRHEARGFLVAAVDHPNSALHGARKDFDHRAGQYAEDRVDARGLELSHRELSAVQLHASCLPGFRVRA